MKKITSVVLALCLVLSCFTVCSYATFAATLSDDASTGASSSSQYAQDTVQGGAILHCFDWSYNNIKANMKDIYNAGYTAVQVSPVQTPKDYSASYTDGSSNWWKMYQPLDFNIASSGKNWFGGKSELTALCAEAEKYGVKVIVDIVANHLANDGSSTGIGANVDSAIKNNSSYWHSGQNSSINYSNRYSVTHDSMGMPDLNTGNKDIQNYVLNLLKSCVDCGVDGFRFDAAKHIEVPGDTSGASDFWPTVINGIKSYKSGLYNYGEILGDPLVDINNYTQYMAVTEDGVGTDVRNAATSSSSGAGDNMKVTSYYKTHSASSSVLWVESHDNYLNDGTNGISSKVINRAWAIIGSRNSSTALYFARPNSTMGQASSDTSWKDTSVAEVNKFKNYFDGTSEYMASYYRVAYNIRNGQGVVISNLDGAGSIDIPNPNGTMASGTYTDQVSGSKFTVTSSRITGTTGSSGVAVVYNPSAGVSKPKLSSDYYLVGYFNGADYDGTDYKFKGGSETATLTTTFTKDSYVHLKNSDSSSYYMLSKYSEGPSATYHKTLGYGDNTYSEKMFVPGNVSVTFTLSQNSDGTLNLSYTTGSQNPTPAATTAATTTAATSAAKTLKSTYYMVGNINGADYGCEGDYSNMGTYKFAAGSNGKITASFTKSSYVFVKKANNADWYMLKSYNSGSSTGSSDTFYSTSTGTYEKMKVPANTTYEFTLVENSDGSLTLSYALPKAETTTASSDKTYSLNGNFYTDGWTNGIEMKPSGANTVSATVELKAGTYAFKIKPSSGSWYGNNGTIEDTTETTSPNLGWKMSDTVDCNLKASGGTYTFIFNTSTEYLIVKYDGGNEPKKEYCLFGSINGADYGKNDDYMTIGDYVFDENGKLTAEFDTVSYVAVKTTDNNTWYMLEEPCTGTTATFHISIYGDETYQHDMRVPAGKVEFTLTENADETVTLSYILLEEPTEEPTTVKATEEPTTEEPTTVKPTEAPTTEEPTTVKPTEAPTTAAPTTIEPTEEPTTAAPTTIEPTEEPTTAAPTTIEPTEEPTTEKPTEAPTTEEPTEPPTTEPTTTPDGLHNLSMSHSIALDGKVGVFFNYDLPDEVLNAPNVYVKFTCGYDENTTKTSTFPLSDATINASGKYRFEYYVDSPHMTDNITAQLFVNGRAYSTIDAYSVKTYADAVIASTNPAFDSLKPLVKAMLYYGARAQIQFGYNTDNLADSDLGDYTPDPVSAEELEGIVDVRPVETQKAGVGIDSYSNMTLVLDSDTMARIYLNVSDPAKFTAAKFTYTIEGDSKTYTAEVYKSIDRYVVDIPGIASSQLGKTITLDIQYSRFRYRVTFSANAYVKKALTSSAASETLKDTVTALYNYNRFALQYFS